VSARNRASGLEPGDPRHGTVNGYDNHRCRCDDCKAAWARISADRRRRRAYVIRSDDERHGTNSFYCNHGCRCPACTEAAASTQRRLREQQLLNAKRVPR
jgi:hypothetical protein